MSLNNLFVSCSGWGLILYLMFLFLIKWEGGRIIGLGWTSSENLVCVLDEGTMVVYNLHGDRVFTRPIARVSLEELHMCMCVYAHFCSLK